MKTLYKFIMIALALCLCFAVPVSAAHRYYDADKYVDTNPVIAQKNSIDSYQGTIKVIVRSGYNTLTPQIGIRNDANPKGVNGTFTFFPIQPDGIAENITIPGQFTLYIPNSNGGQDEYAHVTVSAGTISYVSMLGHAVSVVVPEVGSAAPEQGCPFVTTFGWFYGHDVFRFDLKNEFDTPKWSTIEYTISYQKQIPCPSVSSVVYGPPHPPKCYEPAQFTKTLMFPRYSPAESTTPQFGFADYPTGSHKDEKLISVLVKSCEGATCESQN